MAVSTPLARRTDWACPGRLWTMRPNDRLGFIGGLELRHFCGADSGLHAFSRIAELRWLGSADNRGNETAFDNSHAIATCAGDSPRSFATAFSASTTAWSAGRLYRPIPFRDLERTVPASRLPANRPLASGLQGMSPTPSSTHSGIISLSSSR